ncbi:MAG: hypothetical protein M1839_008634 [Geoglossum umbratile]|nr:MAG: hypothetical protein M1839_008634 [Geoglossum umbratile]
MLSNKPSTLLSSSGSINRHFGAIASPPTAAPPRLPLLWATSAHRRRDEKRRLGLGMRFSRRGWVEGDLRWPELSANVVPTPYQIFNQNKDAPYSKQRFYELVKLYHPDRNGHTEGNCLSNCGVSRAVGLERYRLVVAANSILSDPIKRDAYDRYGAGWNGLPEVRGHGNNGDNPASDGWGERGSPSQNATWEDWERWYGRDAQGPQSPQIFSNSAFLSLVVFLSILGGIAQATRAENSSMNYLEERYRLHDEMSKDLMKRRRETTISAGKREQKILNFLKMRDPVGFGVAEPLEERYKRV